MRRISSLAVIAVLSVLTGCSSCTAIEHGNVAFDVSPDGKRIVFSAADGDRYLFHLETQHVDRLTSTAQQDSTSAFAPDGRSVVFSTSSNAGRECLDRRREYSPYARAGQLGLL